MEFFNNGVIIIGVESTKDNALSSLNECRELILSSSEINEELIQQIKKQRQDILTNLNESQNFLYLYNQGYSLDCDIAKNLIAIDGSMRFFLSLMDGVLAGFIINRFPQMSVPAVVISGGFLAGIIIWDKKDQDLKKSISKDIIGVGHAMDSLEAFVDTYREDEAHARKKIDDIINNPNATKKKETLLQIMDNSIESLKEKKDTKETLEDLMESFTESGATNCVNLIAKALSDSVEIQLEKKPQALETLLFSIINCERPILKNTKELYDYCYGKGTTYFEKYVRALLIKERQTPPQEVSTSTHSFYSPQLPLNYIQQAEPYVPLEETLLLESYNNALSEFQELIKFIEPRFIKLNQEINKVVSKKTTPEEKIEEIKELVRSLVKELEDTYLNNNSKKQAIKVPKTS